MRGCVPFPGERTVSPASHSFLIPGFTLESPGTLLHTMHGRFHPEQEKQVPGSVVRAPRVLRAVWVALTCSVGCKYRPAVQSWKPGSAGASMSVEGKQWLADNFLPSAPNYRLDQRAGALALTPGEGSEAGGRWRIDRPLLGAAGRLSGLGECPHPIHVLPGISEHGPIWKWGHCRYNGLRWPTGVGWAPNPT